MNPERIRSFSLRRTQLQQQIYGRTVTLNGERAVHATVGPVTHRHKLEIGGFLPEVDTLIRISRAHLCDLVDPDEAVGWQIVDSRTPDKVYIVEEVKDDPLDVEVIFGCRADG
ncbi:hypothetical protein QEH52_01745 [Coraliomargarita sp. SDUM461003]|uniref:Phage head-tail adapter protein n=1 Tax=Thalassobacterium maritimum TaxID=3041265 RepID=A0ABU1APZ7_9BACT|nr:hypothetical protein [Coraliomargarita sp. SDUM461003]MDQ8206215.1 hypothetical protein [Coraliomargarita sp. SDUM461003]